MNARLLNKPQFLQNDRVLVKGLNDVLDGKVGVIVGQATENIMDFWIVQFDDVISEVYPYTTCTIPHVHLMRVQ